MNRKEFAMSAFHGAVYFPSKVYNAYQTYEYFDASELERDFSYAEKAGITALRIFTSYEQYQIRHTAGHSRKTQYPRDACSV